jgi:uncharacterized membrane protein YcaP (DUF421 family)
MNLRRPPIICDPLNRSYAGVPVFLMNNPPFHLLDVHRIFFGNAQPTFLIEVWLRTSVTYFLLIVAMRFLGRRVAAQFTLFEISIVVTLAAAIGVPLQASDRGLLPPLIIAVVVIVLQRTLTRFGVRHRQFETTVSTDVTTLVRDGVLQLLGMSQANIGRKKVFETLRLNGYQHLGEVSRVYMEPSGSMSIIRSGDDHRPGLSVIPELDADLVAEAQANGYFSCTCCGSTKKSAERPTRRCELCGTGRWLPSIHQLDK